MTQVAEIEKNEIIQNKEDSRETLLFIEDCLSKHPGAVAGDSSDFPLKHSFADGMYVREIFIPKGSILVGKIHLHEHPNFLMMGEVVVYTEGGGTERIKAPKSIISPAGTKRFVQAISDTIWTTVHSNIENTRDLDRLEEIVIAPTYEDYEKFRNLAGGDKNINLLTT